MTKIETQFFELISERFERIEICQHNAFNITNFKHIICLIVFNEVQVIFIVSLIGMFFSFDQIKSDLVEQKNEFSESCIAGDERTEKSKLVMKRRQRKNQPSKKIRD